MTEEKTPYYYIPRGKLSDCNNGKEYANMEAACAIYDGTLPKSFKIDYVKYDKDVKLWEEWWKLRGKIYKKYIRKINKAHKGYDYSDEIGYKIKCDLYEELATKEKELRMQ